MWKRGLATGLHLQITSGFDRVYTDSGGLQIVTRGMSANENAKEEIYKIQSQHDLTMCFDEIPVRNEKMAHRTGYLDKVFVYEDFHRCAKATAMNVISQVNAFRRMKSNTKIFFIVQGNTLNDMLEWFDIATQTIPADYWDHIGGLAIGGVAIGSGQREDVEKIAIYKKIREEFGTEYTKKHLHILGVGSASRLMPIIILRNTGFIPRDTHISYDSTTLSMAYIFGNFIDENGDYLRDTPLWDVNFLSYYNMITPILKDYGFTDKQLHSYYPYIIKDMLCHKKILADNKDDQLRVAHHAIRVLTNVFQILRFTKNLYKLYTSWDQGNDPISMLKNVCDMDSFYEWEKVYASKLQSKRITRKTTNLVEEIVFSDQTIADKSVIPKTVNKRSKSTLESFWE